MKRTAKSLVMKPQYRTRVISDKSKYKRRKSQKIEIDSDDGVKEK